MKPGEGTKLKKGDKVTYEISYYNYLDTKADIVITDPIDDALVFVKANKGGVYKDGEVVWKLKDVPAGEEGKVTIVLKLKDDLKKGGKVYNTATVKVGNDPEMSTNKVQNPHDKTVPPKGENPGEPTKSRIARTMDDSKPLVAFIIADIALLAMLVTGRRRKKSGKGAI